VKLALRPGDKGSYESPVHDAGTVARWGRLSWLLGGPAAAGVRFETRSRQLRAARQNLERLGRYPGRSRHGLGGKPNARYIQGRATLTRDGRKAPGDRRRHRGVLPQNTQPVIKSINVTPSGRSGNARPATPATPGGHIQRTVTDTGVRSRHLGRHAHADADAARADTDSDCMAGRGIRR
jgi:hypothetical protein